MGSNQTDNESNEISDNNIEWSTEEEIQLFYAICIFRPVGINRHFHMAAIVQLLRQTLNRFITSDNVWAYLRSHYDIDSLNLTEPLPFPNYEQEFSLPVPEYAELMARKCLSNSESLTAQEQDSVNINKPSTSASAPTSTSTSGSTSASASASASASINNAKQNNDQTDNSALMEEVNDELKEELKQQSITIKKPIKRPRGRPRKKQKRSRNIINMESNIPSLTDSSLSQSKKMSKIPQKKQKR